MLQIQTTYIDNVRISQEMDITFIPDDHTQELSILNIYPQIKKQTIRGFGGAFTESAGYVWSHLTKDLQEECLNAYFGKDGLGYTLGRVPLDSCDFSLDNYSAVDDRNDVQLSSFSLQNDERYILPFLRAAQVKTPQLAIMLSPWSPPAFMKTNAQKNNGGKLKEEFRSLWAEYICRYIQEYKNNGIEVFALSVQNEPNAVQKWDSCIFTAQEERDFISDYLALALDKYGHNTILLTIWDHNKERMFDRAETILAIKKNQEIVGAIGYHWYSGEHFEALDLLKQKFPDKELIFTEGCIEYSRFDSVNQLAHAQMYAREIISGLGHGMSAFLDWNLLLNHEGGPNHVGNYCEAPIMSTLEGCLRYNLSYYYISHFTRYITPGSRVVGFTRYSQNVEIVACENPDSSLICVAMNTTANNEQCYLRLHANIAKVTLAPFSISTFIIKNNS